MRIFIKYAIRSNRKPVIFPPFNDTIVYPTSYINVDKHRRESKKRQFTNLLGRVNMSSTGVTLYTADRNAFLSLPSLAGKSHSNSEH